MILIENPTVLIAKRKMTMLEILSMAATLMGVLLSLVFGIRSIELTKQQISISNKQELFDRRFECYRLLSHIHTLCENNLSVTQKNTSEGFLGTSTPIKKSWKIKHAGNALESYIKKLVLDDDVTKKADIIPWSKGGHTTDDNLQMLCKKCNAAKADK